MQPWLPTHTVPWASGDYAKSPASAQVASPLDNKEAVGISLIKKELRPIVQIIRLPSVSSF